MLLMMFSFHCLRVCESKVKVLAAYYLLHRRYALHHIFYMVFICLPLRLSISVVSRPGLWRCIDRAVHFVGDLSAYQRENRALVLVSVQRSGVDFARYSVNHDDLELDSWHRSRHLLIRLYFLVESFRSILRFASDNRDVAYDETPPVFVTHAESAIWRHFGRSSVYADIYYKLE